MQRQQRHRRHKAPARSRPTAELLEKRLTLSALGMTSIVEHFITDPDSVVVDTSATWTASSDSSWLHTTSSGTGKGVATFSLDANSSSVTRTGRLTVAGQTLTVTQTSGQYTPTNPLTTLTSSGLAAPRAVAMDGSGNVYISDSNNSAIKKWSATTGQVTTLVTGLNRPTGVAVDSSGNLYIADTSNAAVKKWSAANGQVTTLVNTGSGLPRGIATDVSGNVYFTLNGFDGVQKWNAANGQVTNVISSGLAAPEGLAVDVAGNVYVADSLNGAVKKWNVVNGQVTTLASGLSSSPLAAVTGVAVDGSGDVYIADTGNNVIKKWSAVTGQVTTVVGSGLVRPWGVAADAAGGIAIADTNNSALKALPRAFVPIASRSYRAGAASVSLTTLPILPTTQPLVGALAPTSSENWLTVSNQAGVISYSIAENTSAADRSASINVLGQSIGIEQLAPHIVGTLSDNLSTNPLSLRQAVAMANQVGGVDTISDVIVIPMSLYSTPTIGQPDPNTIRLGSEFQILQPFLNLKIRAEVPTGGARTFSVSAENLGRIIQVRAGASLTLENLTLTSGHVPNGSDGGAIVNGGMLTLTNSAITNCTAVKGGGIVNVGTVHLTNSLLSGNTATQAGGGIFNLNGTVTVDQSTISNNTANPSLASGVHGAGGGAGVWSAGGSLSVNDSIVSGNLSDVTGGSSINGGAGIAVSDGATLTLSDSTLTDNHADTSGGAVFVYNASAIVQRCSFARNQAGWGGGLVNIAGTASIQDSYFTQNELHSPRPTGAGGVAIAQVFRGANMTIDRCTFSGNLETSTIMNSQGSDGSASSMVITNSSVVNNWSGIEAPATRADRAITTIVNSTIFGNVNDSSIFDLFFSPGTRSLTNCIVGKMGAGGTLELHGVNLVQNGLVAPNVINADPMLGPLQDNGGLTMTRALLPGSPAINAGVADGSITTDQRGIARPQGTAPDLGAYERQATNAALTSMSYEYESRQAVTFNFSSDASVTFGRPSYALQDLTTGQTVSPNVGTFGFNVNGTRATLVLTNLLPNGDYRVTSGSAAPLDFFVLKGDANHDRKVNFDDYVKIDLGFNNHWTGYSNGDFNYDGVVNFDDYVIIDTAFNTAPTLGRNGGVSAVGKRGAN